MRRRLRIAMLVALALAARAADAQNPPAADTPIVIRPTDRLAWQVDAADNDSDAFLYLAYVDDQITYLTNVSCARVDGASSLECVAAMPALSPGRHTIAVSVLNNEHERIESELSDPIHVEMATSTASANAAANTSAILVAADLDDAIDVSIATDNLIIVGERRGRIVAVHHEQGRNVRVEAWTDALHGGSLAAIEASDGRAVFAVVVDGALATLVRYTITTRGLVDRSVMLTGLPIRAGGAAALSRGPDGKLYLALASGSEQDLGDIGSWRGKVLRLNGDGTLANDQPSVAFGPSAFDPRDLAWQDGRLWMLGANEEGTLSLAEVPNFWSAETTRVRPMILRDGSDARTITAADHSRLLVGGPLPTAIEMDANGSVGAAILIAQEGELRRLRRTQELLVACLNNNLVIFPLRERH